MSLGETVGGTGGIKLGGRGTARQVAYQLLLWAKQTQLGEN